MGKHTAANGSTVDPLVADALARRSGPPAAAHRGEGGSTGWPEPAPGGGGGLGWPEEPRPEQAEPRDGGSREADAPADREEHTTAAGPRRGWRRLFSSSPAA